MMCSDDCDHHHALWVKQPSGSVAPLAAVMLSGRVMSSWLAASVPSAAGSPMRELGPAQEEEEEEADVEVLPGG